MKKFKITTEQLQTIEADGCTYVKEWFPDAFNEKLEVGRWYVRKENLKCIICYTDNGSGYGFGYAGIWGNWALNERNIKDFRKATNQEVLEVLTKEAVKKGFKEGRKFTSCVSNFIDICNGYFSYNEELNELYSNGTCVFSNGKWATIIKTKQMTIKEIEKELGYNIEIV